MKRHAHVHEVTRSLLHLFDNAITRWWRGGVGGVLLSCPANDLHLYGLSLIISELSNCSTLMYVERHSGAISLTVHLFDHP